MVDPFFGFARTPRLVFGSGERRRLPELVSGFGARILVVTGQTTLERIPENDPLAEWFRSENPTFRFAICNSEPSPEVIDLIVGECESWEPDCVVAIGGGSVLDAGKAVAAMLMTEGSVMEYLEGVGTKSPPGQSVPLIALPTTAGTGSEATKNAVLSRVGPEGFKKSLRHDSYIPAVAVVDPELTLSCPPAVTRACGLDAFTQLLEAFTSIQASPITDALAWSGLERMAESLKRVCTDAPEDLSARCDVAYGALISGIVLANAGLGVVHGLASPLGGEWPIPHGVVCGTLLGSATRVNVEALGQLSDSPSTLEKYARLGRLLAQEPSLSTRAGTDALCEYLDQLVDDLDLPRLSSFGITAEDCARVAAHADCKQNPVRLDAGQVRGVLLKRL